MSALGTSCGDWKTAIQARSKYYVTPDCDCDARTNSFTSVTTSLGFKHKGKDVVDSIVNGKELEKFIQQHLN